MSDAVIEDSGPQHEILAPNSTCVAKLETRVNAGKPADILCADVDGTLYKKVFAGGVWNKEGNNAATFRELQAKSVPLALISGRPDFDTATDKEMLGLGVTPADLVIAGAGSLIYWRGDQGELMLDQEFLELMKEQKVKYAGKEFSYNPERLLPLLEKEVEAFKQFGVLGARIDRNKGTGFNTIDLTDVSFENLGKLVNHLRTQFAGVKIEFSEDLEKISEGKFSGWMQIVPASGDKDKALRFVLEKVAAEINPYNAEAAKKPVAHVVGDAAIDIWMLAMGTGERDAYIAKGYALGNLTPYAQGKLEIVKKALNSHTNETWRKADLTILTETATDGVAEVANLIEA